MADFASLDGMGGNIPNALPNAERLGLTVPGDVITGTSMGMQALGAQNIKTDPTRQRIVVNDGTNNRVSFGRIGTGTNDWGLKVSKPNTNVDTATNDQLIFNSSQDVFKIIASGTFTIPGYNFSTAANSYSANSQSNQFAHNLSFIPVVQAAITYGAASYSVFPYQIFQSVSNTQWSITWTNIVADSTNIYGFNYTLGYNETSVIPVPSTTVKYYLLQETAN